MKKILFCFICLFIFNNVFAAYQYGVHWEQSNESNTSWNVYLNKNNNFFKEYGLYSLSEAEKNNRLQNWIVNENYFKLEEGINKLNITEDLGVWVKTNKDTYSSMSFSDFYNYKSPGFTSDDYSINIYNNKIGNDDWSGQIYWERNETNAPTGQPLPGVLISLLIGGGVFGTGFLLKRKSKID